MLSLNIFLQTIIIILFILFYFLLGIVLKKIVKILKITNVGIKILIEKIVTIIYSLILLLTFGLFNKNMFLLNNSIKGLIMLMIGIIFSLIIATLSYQTVKNTNYGNKYRNIMINSKIIIFITLLIFVGPAEDLFFIGIIQNIYFQKIGWISIFIYLIFFSLFHFTNVLSGIESKKEFFGMLPIRIIISSILAVSFYLTNSLIYGFVIHNIFDTLNYIAVIIANKKSDLLS